MNHERSTGNWSSDDANAMTAPQEVRIVTRRPDGSLRPPTIIWIVGDGNRVFIRSTNGRGAAWFRTAVAQRTGQVIAGGRTYDVTFTEASRDDLALVDRAYRGKYVGYASIVDHLQTDGPRAATLELTPAR